MNVLLAVLEVLLLGTGYPRPDPQRAGSSTRGTTIRIARHFRGEIVMERDLLRIPAR